MDKEFLNLILKAHQACPMCPSPELIDHFFLDLLGTLFPNYSKKFFASPNEVEEYLGELKMRLQQLLSGHPQIELLEALQIADDFFEQLPHIREMLEWDIRAIYEGDPAAKSEREVARTYLTFNAIAAYRIAHLLVELGVETFPRMITEYAHGKTGIDINPCARIGKHFCIDHGTGTVIGETAEIGDHVKMYQGVTLGALSVKKEDAGSKRHPTIEDHVVLYAGATILGGDTIIGHHSVIGGNVWLTKSVPPYSKVYYQAKMTHHAKGDTDIVIYK